MNLLFLIRLQNENSLTGHIQVKVCSNATLHMMAKGPLFLCHHQHHQVDERLRACKIYVGDLHMTENTAAHIGTRLFAAPICSDKHLGNLDAELDKLGLQQPPPSLLPRYFCY